MNQLISRMNNVLTEWKSTHCIQASLAHFEFHLTETGFLQYQDLLICDANNLQLESASFDPEEILFSFSNLRSITLTITWPMDEDPYVSDLLFHCGFSS